MRLILTIQDVKLKDAEEVTRMIFGTLNVETPDKDGLYDKKKAINFTMPLDNVRGLKKIVRNIQVEALHLKQAERRKGRELSADEVKALRKNG